MSKSNDFNQIARDVHNLKKVHNLKWKQIAIAAGTTVGYARKVYWMTEVDSKGNVTIKKPAKG